MNPSPGALGELVLNRVTVRDRYIRSRERRRAAFAGGVTLAVYALALWGVWLLSAFVVQDLAEYSGPVLVRLGDPEGGDTAIPRTAAELPPGPPMAPSSVSPEPSQPASRSEPASRQAPGAAIVQAPPVEEAAPKPEAQDRVEAPAPIEPPARAEPPAQAVESPRPASTPAQESQAQEIQAPASSPVQPTAATGPATAPAAQTIRGSEAGNSLDTSFDASRGLVGRTLYVEVFAYMPLPAQVPASLIAKLTPGQVSSVEDRLGSWKRWYDLSGDTWIRSEAVPLEERPKLWYILKDSGYDLSQADYKMSWVLRPVSLRFTVNPGKDYAELGEIVMTSTSGFAEIDEAVVYAFKKAVFFNATDRPISARFTYRFE